jgi:hypothetical protein
MNNLIATLTALAATTNPDETSQYPDRKPIVTEWLKNYTPTKKRIDSGDIRTECPCYVDRFTMALWANESGFKVSIQGAELPDRLKRFMIHFPTAPHQPLRDRPSLGTELDLWVRTIRHPGTPMIWLFWVHWAFYDALFGDRPLHYTPNLNPTLPNALSLPQQRLCTQL